MELNHSEMELRNEIIRIFERQRYIRAPQKTTEYDKNTYRAIQQKARLEQLTQYKVFLKKHISTIKDYCRNGSEISPERITLELREVKSGSLEEILFKWWNLAWWSIPYQRPYGRQMRFLLWDTTHNAPFGLFLLQSPLLRLLIRDRYLSIPKEERDIWVNKSMNAQRVGALPPYNELLGGKMVALALTCNEVREAYKQKYRNYITLIKGRKLEPELLFITTMSAFGKSSIYNRLKYNGELVAKSIGYTQGFGTLGFSEELYSKILEFLRSRGINIARGMGRGWSAHKLRLISLGLKYLGLENFTFHGIKREFFLFPLVKNLEEVIQKGQKPIWVDRPFSKLVDYWRKRWMLPRAERTSHWKIFNFDLFCQELLFDLFSQL